MTPGIWSKSFEFLDPLKLFAAINFQISDVVWNWYHNHRRAKLAHAIDAATKNQESFVSAVDTLDLYYRWDLAYSIDRSIELHEKEVIVHSVEAIECLRTARKYLKGKLMETAR